MTAPTDRDYGQRMNTLDVLKRIEDEMNELIRDGSRKVVADILNKSSLRIAKKVMRDMKRK